MEKLGPKLEICAGSFAELIAAMKGGADRSELCPSQRRRPNAFSRFDASRGTHWTPLSCDGPIDTKIMEHDFSNAHFFKLSDVVFGI